MEGSVRAPLVYEVHARAWLQGLARERGRPMTLAEVPTDVFRGWRRLGFTHLWLMGVWSVGARAREHACRLGRAGRLGLPGRVPQEEVCGSPYAIAGYEVDPELGGEPALRVLRQRLGAEGLGLILDFIPNHVAFDHPWTRIHPEWFVGADYAFPESFRMGGPGQRRWLAHGKDPYFPAWSDTAQLDWRLAAVHTAMLHEWLKVGALCDGLRVDMAMLTLPEIFERHWHRLPPAPGQPRQAASFWRTAIPAIKTISPGFLCVAEAYWDLEPTLLSQGFDFAYDKRFYDHLIARRSGEIRRHLTARAGDLLSRGVRFLENHDEHRVACLAAGAEHEAWVALLLGAPGLRLIHEGQLEGARQRADIRTVRRVLEPVDANVARSYHRLLELSNRDGGWAEQVAILEPQPAWEGNPSHDAFVGWQGTTLRGSTRVVVANLAGHAAQGEVMLPTGSPNSGSSWKWVDQISGRCFSSLPETAFPGRMRIELGPHDCVWLQLENGA